MSYSVTFEPQLDEVTGDWVMRLDKEYLPWERWEQLCREGLDRYGEETRAAEELLSRLEFERAEQRERWLITAHLHAFHRFAQAARDIFEGEMMPLFQDPSGYHWEPLKGMLVELLRAEGVEYPRLAEPAYLVDHLDAARATWGILECIAQVNGAKWELGIGECGNRPDPTEFRYPPRAYDVEIGGWFARHFGVPDSVDNLIARHGPQFPPADSLQSIQALANNYGPRAAELVFGQVWAARWGHDALLADFEATVADREDIVRLNWIWPQRVRR